MFVLAATSFGSLTGAAGAQAACPSDNGGAPADVKAHFCGAWNSAPAGALGSAFNDAHRWGSGWIRDVGGGSWGTGAIMEGDGVGFAYIIAQEYWPAFLSQGNDSSGGPLLGYPTGSAVFGGHIHQGTNGNLYMTLQHGVINKWAGGTFETHGAVLTKWNSICGASGCNVSGPAGRPLSNEQQTLRVPGRVEKFEGGNIIYNPAVNGAFLIYGGILNKYSQLGYSDHPLGLPTGDRQHNATKGNDYQTFDGGVINQYGGQAYETHGALFAKWNALGGANGPVGLPTSDEQQTARVNGRYATFQGGNLIFDPATGKTWLVYGGILNKYGSVGYSQSGLGLPTNDRQHNNAKGNDYQTFQGGVINQYGGNAYISAGAILATWNALGGANGPVGLPTSDEQATARVPGRVQSFQGGNLIYNSQSGQTFLVYGGILKKYAELGYSNHPLGLPTSYREHNAALGNDYQTFQGGVINQYGGNAYETHGAVLDRWNRAGGAGGSLGLPTSDEGATARSPQGTVGRYGRFQRGLINYNPRIDKAIVLFGSIKDKYASLGYSGSYLGLPTSEEYGYAGGKRQTFEGGHIVYEPGRGAETDRELSRGTSGPPSTSGGLAGGGSPIPRPTGATFRLRALGDSVTAAYGFRPNGQFIAKPSNVPCIANPASDQCSSPGVVAWPAQFAKHHPGIDFYNYAKSGATPGDWVDPGGKYHPRLLKLLDDQPTMIVLTLGANPILSSFIAGTGSVCANTDVTGEATQGCVEDQLQRNRTVDRLTSLYESLLRAGHSTVVVSLYHYTEPKTLRATRTKYLLVELNAAIATAWGRAVRAMPLARGRIRLMAPGDFRGHGCTSASPWIIDTDTCIHPNQRGHGEYAAHLEAVYNDARVPRGQTPASAVANGSATYRTSVRVSEAVSVVGQISRGGGSPRTSLAQPSSRFVATTVGRATRSGRVTLVYRLSRRARGIIAASARKRHSLTELLTLIDKGGNARQLQVRLRAR